MPTTKRNSLNNRTGSWLVDDTLDVTAGNITAAAGNINATLGSINAGTSLSAGTFAIAGTTVTAGTDLISTAGHLKLPLTNGAGSAGQIMFGGIRTISNYGTGNNNFFAGNFSGNLTNTGANNIGMGVLTMSMLTSGDQNVGIGLGALRILTSGSFNTGIGEQALTNLTTGSLNTTVGNGPLRNLVTGIENVAFGSDAGSNYTGAESNNILIQNLGVLGESNTIRMGLGTHTRTFISGIYNIAIGATSGVVQCDSAGQLGSSNGSNGQVLIGGGTAPAWAAITAGTGVTITNAAGGITVASTGGGTLWVDVTGASASMIIDTGYVADNAGLVTLTLPAVAAFGSVVKVVGKAVGGWLIAQNAGQTIGVIGTATTVGVGGSLASTNRYDCVEVVCVTANTTWVARSITGNLTIV